MNHRRAQRLALLLSLALLAMLVSACGTEPAGPTAAVAETETAVPPMTATVQAEPASATTEPESSEVIDDVAEVKELAEKPDGSAAEEIEEAVAERTPVPTPTAGPVEAQVDDLTAATGLAGKSFLGLTAEDWINMVISLLIAVLGYFVGIVIGVRLVVALLKLITRHTASRLDDAILDSIGREMKWLVMLIVVRYALLRLDFWSEEARIIIHDISFILGIGIIVAIALKLIGVGAQWYEDNLESDAEKARLKPLILLARRFGEFLVIVAALSYGLSHFGITVTALSAMLIVFAVVISFGAKDIISDALSGFIILLDQPFRVGDVIAIEELNKWGDVVDIGTRTTRIVTRDNRSVVVPNSKIAASQIINYTFPDTRYRAHVDLRVAYGADFDQVRRVVKSAVKGVEGVLADKPVDVLFREYGDSARLMRVRVWIDDMHEEMITIDRVNEALEQALTEAGIDIPFTSYDLNVKLEEEKASST